MPLYDYDCGGCGPFRAFRPMSEAQHAQPCPRCGAAAPRQLVAPMLATRSPTGWLGGSAAGGGGWRAACGLGCNHASCR